MFKKDWIRSLSAIVLAVLLALVPGAIARRRYLIVHHMIGRKITFQPNSAISLAPS